MLKNSFRVVALAAALATTPAHAATQFSFTLDSDYTVSAAVYDEWGYLVRTLARAEAYGPGGHTLSWDNRDDAGNDLSEWPTYEDEQGNIVPYRYQLKLLKHRVNYVWEGVIGNTSVGDTPVNDPVEAFSGRGVIRSFMPPRSLAIGGNRLFFATGYNEGQTGLHGFDLSNPQHDILPLEMTPLPSPMRANRGIDPFISLDMVATDGERLYIVNGGNAMIGPGLAHQSFVLVASLETRDYLLLPAGQVVCLNYRGAPRPFPPNEYYGHTCYEDQYYRSAIDVTSGRYAQPTGLAVQAQGSILAVAHGAQGVVKLFDKTSGAFLRSFAIPTNPEYAGGGTLNQLAMAPNGDLWVISGTQLLRYTNLAGTPTLAVTAGGFARPLAVAVHPSDDNVVYVADGAGSQKVKGIDRNGNSRMWGFGQAGGPPNPDPAVRNDRISFAFSISHDGWSNAEMTSLAVEPDGSLWIGDTGNGRLLHIGAYGQYLGQVAYRPHSYVATVDPNRPERVFSNFLEYQVDTLNPLQPGADGDSWTLVRNWRHNFPIASALARNFQSAGLNTVTTLPNGRTYALAVGTDGDDYLVELPGSGPARDTGIRMTMACPGASTRCVLYENGDLGYAVGTQRSSGQQRVYRKPLAGFDAGGNPMWAAPQLVASVPTGQAGTPYYRGAWPGLVGPRFPLTQNNRVVFFDQAVVGNEGFHLGAVRYQDGWYEWMGSPTGWLDGKGSFQTKAIDNSIHYGGNAVWARGRHIVYGFHGEFHADHATGHIGQANQFMHFHEEGLFIGQFGERLLNAGPPVSWPGPRQAGNSFSNILVDGGRPGVMYWYHNDESAHGGVHRWRIENLDSLSLLSGTGLLDSSVTLQPLAP